MIASFSQGVLGRAIRKSMLMSSQGLERTGRGV